MYVKDHMKKNPVTITSKATISKAVEIMGRNDFHRLPVVDGEGRIIGLITGGLVEESSGSKNTSLSIFELNYLLSKRKVEDIMIQNVAVTTGNAFLEEAANQMLDAKISCLPVVDDDMKVIGIITEKDIFEALVDIMGYGKRGTRYVISCDDHPGFMEGVCHLFTEYDVNVESLAVFRTEERGTELVAKLTGEISAEDLRDLLKTRGYKVTDIVQTNAEGQRIRFPV